MRPETYLGLNSVAKRRFIMDIPKMKQIPVSIPIEEVKKKVTTSSDVIELGTYYFKLQREDLIGPSRLRPIVIARQIVTYVLSRSFNETTVAIGKMLNRDHSSIIYSLRTVEDLYQTDKEYRKLVNDFINQL